MTTLGEGILQRVATMESLLSESHKALHEMERKLEEKDIQIRDLRYMLARAEAAAVEWMKRASCDNKEAA